MMMKYEDVDICEAMEAPFLMLEPGMELIHFDSLFCVPASAIVVPVTGAKANANTNYFTTNDNTNTHVGCESQQSHLQSVRCTHRHRRNNVSGNPPSTTTFGFKPCCVFKRVAKKTCSTTTSNGLMCHLMPISTRSQCFIGAEKASIGGGHCSIICETLQPLRQWRVLGA